MTGLFHQDKNLKLCKPEDKAGMTSSVLFLCCSNGYYIYVAVTYAKTNAAGGVATVIIKVGQEEYMNYDDSNSTKYGRLGETGPTHPLYMVRDWGQKSSVCRHVDLQPQNYRFPPHY